MQLPRALAVALEFFFSSRRRHTRFDCDWSSDVCSSDLAFEQEWNGIDCTIEEAFDACQSYWDTKNEIANWGRFKNFLDNDSSKKPFLKSNEIGRASCRERV